MADAPTALLLIAHGSREPAANDDLNRLAAELRATRRYTAVFASFLELVEPDIDAGGAAVAVSGAARVVLVPYFLSAGMHVRHDLTAARDRLAVRFPNVDFRLAEPLGPHPLLTEIIRQRVGEIAEAARP